MTTINLKDFYYWYTQDQFIEVSDEVAEVFLADGRHEMAYQRRLSRHKAQYSLDCEDGIEYSPKKIYSVAGTKATALSTSGGFWNNTTRPIWTSSMMEPSRMYMWMTAKPGRIPTVKISSGSWPMCIAAGSTA